RDHSLSGSKGAGNRRAAPKGTDLATRPQSFLKALKALKGLKAPRGTPDSFVVVCHRLTSFVFEGAQGAQGAQHFTVGPLERGAGEARGRNHWTGPAVTGVESARGDERRGAGHGWAPLARELRGPCLHSIIRLVVSGLHVRR